LIGLLLALVGILFAVGGASIDTVFAGAYNLVQFCGWEWGPLPPSKGRPTLHAHVVHPARPRDGDRHDRGRPRRSHRVRDHTVIPWQAIVRIEGTRIVVRDDAI